MNGSEYMRGRLEDIADLLDRARRDDDAIAELDELPLSYDREVHVRIVLGTGGPHDELDVNVTRGTVTYMYAWGSERFETLLPADDPVAAWALGEAELMADAAV